LVSCSARTGKINGDLPGMAEDEFYQSTGLIMLKSEAKYTGIFLMRLPE